MTIDAKLDSALLGKGLADDIDTPAKIFWELGLIYSDELDETQLMALNIAKIYQEDKESNRSKRDAYKLVLSDRMDRYLREGVDDTRKGILNRIVWCSLVITGELTYEVCEFIEELAMQLGADEETLDTIFAKHIIGYNENQDRA